MTLRKVLDSNNVDDCFHRHTFCVMRAIGAQGGIERETVHMQVTHGVVGVHVEEKTELDVLVMSHPIVEPEAPVSHQLIVPMLNRGFWIQNRRGQLFVLFSQCATNQVAQPHRIGSRLMKLLEHVLGGASAHRAQHRHVLRRECHRIVDAEIRLRLQKSDCVSELFIIQRILLNKSIKTHPMRRGVVARDDENVKQRTTCSLAFLGGLVRFRKCRLRVDETLEAPHTAIVVSDCVVKERHHDIFLAEKSERRVVLGKLVPLVTEHVGAWNRFAFFVDDGAAHLVHHVFESFSGLGAGFEFSRRSHRNLVRVKLLQARRVKINSIFHSHVQLQTVVVHIQTVVGRLWSNYGMPGIVELDDGHGQGMKALFCFVSVIQSLVLVVQRFCAHDDAVGKSAPRAVHRSPRRFRTKQTERTTAERTTAEREHRTPRSTRAKERGGACGVAGGGSGRGVTSAIKLNACWESNVPMGR